MYMTKCSKCGKIFQTEIEYCSYICEECTQKKKEYDSHQKDRDMALLERARQEMERIKATGSKEEIELKTRYYNLALALFKKKYGDV